MYAKYYTIIIIHYYKLKCQVFEITNLNFENIYRLQPLKIHFIYILNILILVFLYVLKIEEICIHILNGHSSINRTFKYDSYLAIHLCYA